MDLIKTRKLIFKFSDFLGLLCIYSLILMLFNVFYDVVARYVFNTNSIGMQEMEWHLFSFVFLIGIPYTLKDNKHVCVDIFYGNWSKKTQGLINCLGGVFFILPISILILYGGIEFANEAFKIKEISPNPGGLHFRFLVKSLIPLSFTFNIIATIGFILDNWLKYKSEK